MVTISYQVRLVLQEIEDTVVIILTTPNQKAWRFIHTAQCKAHRKDGRWLASGNDVIRFRIILLDERLNVITPNVPDG